MSFFCSNLKLIRSTWDYSSQQDFGQLFGLNRGNINSYENGKNKPPMDFLFKLEELTGFTIRELHNEKINKNDISDRPYRHGEGMTIIKDKSDNLKQTVWEPAIIYGNQVANTDNETLIVQRKLIALLEARVKELEEQILKLKA